MEPESSFSCLQSPPLLLVLSQIILIHPNCLGHVFRFSSRSSVREEYHMGMGQSVCLSVAFFFRNLAIHITNSHYWNTLQ
jgi:hypothetical protein